LTQLRIADCGIRILAQYRFHGLTPRGFMLITRYAGFGLFIFVPRDYAVRLYACRPIRGHWPIFSAGSFYGRWCVRSGADIVSAAWSRVRSGSDAGPRYSKPRNG